MSDSTSEQAKENQEATPMINIHSILGASWLAFPKLLKKCGITKKNAKGESAVSIIYNIIISIFSRAKSLHERYSLINMPKPDALYDTVMRFMKVKTFNWSLLLLLFAKAFIKHVDALNDAAVKAYYLLAVDDTPISRNRSTKVELSARCFNHITHSMYTGFRNLAISWTDGNSTFGVFSHLLSSSKPENRKRKASKKDKRTCAAERRRIAATKMPEVVMYAIKRIQNIGIPFSYVLFDSWFFSNEILVQLRQMGITAICRVKSNLYLALTQTGKALTQKQILKDLKKKGMVEGILGSAIAYTAKGIKVKVVFVVNRAKPSQFITLLSTDLSLDSKKIVEIYSRRWNIECQFQACKTYYGLESESFARDYDVVSAMNIVQVIRFSIVELIRRYEIDMRSHGKLFRDSCDQLQAMPYEECIDLLVDTLNALPEEMYNAGIIVGESNLARAKELVDSKIALVIAQTLQHIGALVARERKALKLLGKIQEESQISNFERAKAA